jgi:hypothetical protein
VTISTCTYSSTRDCPIRFLRCCATLSGMASRQRASVNPAPLPPEQVRGARIVNPAPGATKWGWLTDVASNWSVPLIVLPWPHATEDTCRGIRGALNGNRGTTHFRWSVRLRGDSIVIARFGLKPSLLHRSDSERAESRATFASLAELGWPNPTGPRRRGSPLSD